MPPQATENRINVLTDLIKLYEEKKLPLDINSLNWKFSTEIGFTIIIPALAVILSSIFINLSSALAPLIVGSVNAIDKLTISKSLIATYGKDKEALQSRVTNLYVKIRIASIQSDVQKQTSMLDSIQEQIIKYFPEIQLSANQEPVSPGG